MIKFSVLVGIASFFSIIVIGDAAAQVSSQIPGTRHHLRPADMPLPFATPSSANPSKSVPLAPGKHPLFQVGIRSTSSLISRVMPDR